MKLRKSPFYFLFGLFLILGVEASAQEICDNGKDDDGDGFTDLQDPDCQCHFQVTGNLLQNGSFEAFDHCPISFTYDSDAHIANGWAYGTHTNKNEAYYYHNLSCPLDSAQIMLFQPPSLPLPDGKAFISIRQYVYRKPDMKETDIAKTYIGQCLQTPLQPGTQYTLSFNAGRFQSNDDADFKYKAVPFTVAVFGNADCNAVPFGQSDALSNGCPANYSGWTLLGKTTMHSKGRWIQGTINFTVPNNINVIEIGPDCSVLNPSTELADSTTVLDFYVYYLDDIHLLPTKSFPFTYIQNISGDPCANDSVLTAPTAPNATYQWYKNGIAIQGATDNTFSLPFDQRNGTYNVRTLQQGSCSVSQPFVVQPNALTQLRLPADTGLCNGDSIQLAPSLNGVVYNWNGNEDTKVQVNEAGVYNIAATANGCTRTFTVMVHALDCKNAAINMPNAFTPNGDGKNDLFRIPPETIFKIREFSIFNRWGNLVFSTANSNVSWDGTFKGKNCPIGTYVYFIKVVLNGREQIVKGTVLLIR